MGKFRAKREKIRYVKNGRFSFCRSVPASVFNGRARRIGKAVRQQKFFSHAAPPPPTVRVNGAVENFLYDLGHIIFRFEKGVHKFRIVFLL